MALHDDETNALSRVVWDGRSIQESLEQLAEWNRVAERMKWKTNKWYWKNREKMRVRIGRWTYEPPEEEEVP